MNQIVMNQIVRTSGRKRLHGQMKTHLFYTNKGGSGSTYIVCVRIHGVSTTRSKRDHLLLYIYHIIYGIYHIIYGICIISYIIRRYQVRVGAYSQYLVCIRVQLLKQSTRYNGQHVCIKNVEGLLYVKRGEQGNRTGESRATGQGRAGQQDRGEQGNRTGESRATGQGRAGQQDRGEQGNRTGESRATGQGRAGQQDSR